MASRFEEFLRTSNFFYTSIGMRPYKNFDNHPSKRKQIILEFIFYTLIVNLNAHIIGQTAFIYLSFQSRTGFVECIVTAAIIGFIIVADGKLLSIWCRKRTLTHLISELKKIHPKTLNDQRAFKLRIYLRQVTRVTVLFSTLFLMLTWTFNLVPTVKYIYCMVVGQEFVRYLPYSTYAPWEWRTNAWFWIFNLSQNIAGHVAGSAVPAADTLLCALVTLVCMHFDYLAQQIEEYVPSGGDGDMQFIGQIIAYHQMLLTSAKQLNSIFGIPLLLNFAASSIIICFVGFHLAAGLGGEEMIKFVLYLISALTQVYMICYYGEMMTQASGNIGQALYKQIWYMKATTSYKKCLLCMMHKAQEPLHLQATVFLPVSMKAFTEIGQLSYKFFTLLRTMYN